MFKKDALILKMLLCEFCASSFEAIPQPSCYFTSIVDKAQRGPVIVPFSLQFLQLFLGFFKLS